MAKASADHHSDEADVRLVLGVPTAQYSVCVCVCMYRVFAEQLLIIFKSHPTLVMEYHREMQEYLCNLRNLVSAGEYFYHHLVSVRQGV